MDLLVRAIAYTCVGITAEVIFTGVKALLFEKKYGMPGFTTLWMIPIYGLLVPFGFEPLHDWAASWHWVLRGVTYAILILVVEYLAATLYKRILGENPWEYTKGLHVHGKIRLDYAPFWMAFGLGLEQLHLYFLKVLQ